MSDQKTNLDSLFEAASEIESAEQRAAFLQESCGDDVELRQQLEQLLRSSDQAGSFLEKPPAGLEETVRPDASGGDRRASLDAGLATAFSASEAVVIGDASHSVLRSLGNTLDEVPRIALRESAAEGPDPISRPNSPDVPKSDADSRYRLDGEIARGGMGAIIKGRDTDLGRDLAIKVLLDSHKDKPEVIQRFVEEAQIGGQLQHPGIAPIYELGQFKDKRPFFAMKLVKGQTLSKLLADRKDAADERGKFIGIFEQVCQTMAYAHSRGVIHRDLKPANIMVGAFGEVQVMDWGLAKVLQVGGVADEKRSQHLQQEQSIIQTLRSGVGSDPPGTFGGVGSETQMGSVMGTPAYMPPEQALGEIDNLDERADVFGLGAILCEILTGKPPYVAEDGTQVYRMASRGKLGDCFTRLDQCGADPDLIALTKQCLELEPIDRPRDAGVLAERVTGYLELVETKLRQTEMERAAEAARAEAESLKAKAESERAQAEIKRRRATIALAASVLMMIGLGSASFLWIEQQETRRQADLASAQRTQAEQAERARDEYRELLYAADMAVVEQAWEDGSVAKATSLLERQIPREGQEDLRGFEWFCFWGWCESTKRAPTYQPELDTRFGIDMLLSPDGTQLAAFSWDKRAGVICDLSNNETKDVQDFVGDSYRQVWSLGGSKSQFAIWQEDGSISIWSLVNGQLSKLWHLRDKFDSIGAVTLSGDLKTLAIWRLNDSINLIELWDVETETQQGPSIELPPEVERSGAFRLIISPDNRHLAFLGHRGSPRIVDIESRTVGQRLSIEGRVWCLEFSSDSQFLLSCTDDPHGQAVIWHVESGEPHGKLVGHTAKIERVTFSPDSKMIASTSSDRNVILWDTETRQPLHVLRGHTAITQSVAFSPDGQILATGAADRSVRLWETNSGQLVEALKGYQSPVTKLQFSMDGSQLASATRDGAIKVWDMVNRGAPRRIQAHEVTPDAVALSPNGKLAATCGSDGFVRVWNLSNGERLHDFEASTPRETMPKGIQTVAFSPDGKSLAVVNSRTVDIWDVETGELKDQLKDQSMRPNWGQFSCVCYSPNGLDVAAGRWDGSGKVVRWDTKTGKSRQELQFAEGVFPLITCVQFSPDGQAIAAGYGQGALIVWNHATSTQLYEYENARDVRVSALAFSDTGQLAVAWEDYLEFLRVEDGHCLGRLQTDAISVLSMAYLPGTTQLLIPGADGKIRRYDTREMREEHIFRGHEARVTGVAFSNDGNTFVSSDDGGVLRIWNAVDKATLPATVQSPQGSSHSKTAGSQ